jgi:hypothetical protein
VLSFIRKSIQGEGFGSILNLALKLKAADPQHKHLLGRKALQAQIPFLQGEHIDIVAKELSENGQDVDYSIIVYDLKGQPDAARLK